MQKDLKHRSFSFKRRWMRLRRDKIGSDIKADVEDRMPAKRFKAPLLLLQEKEKEDEVQ